ncbi:larval serum protein 2-like [Contarinia nasturtii]|uniref:larval serum protein 2-like n=1 Tax=Contarinia nasturtii TaxID=265458 RepID=UPI0012D40E8E|nr:larval serum protein 2-like [Contarinia nasturtii]
MKTILSVLFVSIVAGSYAFSGGRTDFKTFDAATVQKQKAIFELLQHPYQPGVSVYKQEFYDIVQAFDFEKSYNLFSNVDAVKEFYYLYKKGLMPFNELFSIYNEQHRRQAIALFHVFYYAKDWDTFYKTLLWARYNVNPGLFVYSLHVAIVHRTDFAKLQLPAIYEIFPHYFFSFDVIQRAQLMKQQGFAGVNKIDNNVYNYVIAANYSNSYVHSYDSQEVSYFTEDIGLNAYYYYFNIDFPFWMGSSEYNLYKERRGEYIIFFYQQLLARYYLERLSNDLGTINEFSFYDEVTGYYPNLRTYYGYPFKSREDGYVGYRQGNFFNIDFINAYEQHLLEAIDSGRFLLSNGTYYDFTYPGGIEHLGNALQGNPDSLNYKYYGYMCMAYKTFGNYLGIGQYFQGTVYPSVLAQPETTLRDPAYWMFMKKVFSFYDKYVTNAGPYAVKEIAYDGVKIESVNVDKLTTYFDKFDADISNAVDVQPLTEDIKSELITFGRVHHYNGVDYVIKARQSRLNHLPFQVKINVVSTVATPSVVRIYLGPKYDEYGHMINVNENRYNYFLLDMFKYDMTTGNNVITRESVNFFHQVKDRTTYYELYQSLMTTVVGQTQSENVEAHNGFPSRLLLPKGKKGGQVYQLFVHISPYHAPQTPPTNDYGTFAYGFNYVDNLPLYYPLDRPIDEYYWYTPNMYYQDVTIYHKTESEANSP